MAAFQDSLGGPLSHDAQHALVDWLIEESGHKRKAVKDVPVVGEAAKGEAVYAKHCAECHGARGEGGTGTALANPVFSRPRMMRLFGIRLPMGATVRLCSPSRRSSPIKNQ